MTQVSLSSDDIVRLAALREKMVAETERGNGWISFSRYMEMALYEPGMGYYSSGGRKFGEGGDFVTAPEVSSLFGQALAHVIAPLMAQSLPHVLELGAGSGKLARDILAELREMGAEPERYAILELSGDLKARQQETLRDFSCVGWPDRLPESFSGVIIGNEVLDAMPVQLVCRENGEWHELGVSPDGDGFVFSPRKAGAALLEQIARQIPAHGILPEGYVTEVHTHASAFMRSVSLMQKAGGKNAAIFIDYGFPAHEYYRPERNRGTLMTHYRHRAHALPLLAPGLQDITAHVDFSAMAQAVSESGLDILCYATQADFLLAAGITERLARLSPEDALHYLPEAGKLRTLLSPSEMGEIFKVLVTGDLALPRAVLDADRSERL